MDLNFEITNDGIFPLLLATAKGDKELVAMIVNNPRTSLNKCDQHGVNAFWISAFYGHIEIMRYLCSKGIDILSRN